MSLTTDTQAAIDAQEGDFIDFAKMPIHLRLWWSFCVFFFGTFTPSGRLLPHRRWFIRLAFRFRYIGNEGASNFFWSAARWFAAERTHPALAAYSTKMIMTGIVEGRE